MALDLSNHRRHVSTHDLKNELSGRLVHTTSALYELGKYFVVTLVTILTIHSLLATVTIISGPSMLPNFKSNSHILLDRRDWITYQRGDVIVLKYPGDPENRQYIKRIIGLPGETVVITGGQVLINGQPINENYLPFGVQTFPDVEPITLRNDEFFTLGDNRPISNDSRFFGPVERRFIIGRVAAILYEPEA